MRGVDEQSMIKTHNGVVYIYTYLYHRVSEPIERCHLHTSYSCLYYRFSPFVKTGTEAFVLGNITVRTQLTAADRVKIVVSH